MNSSNFISRVRASYDILAADFAEWVRDELAAKPLDRAVLNGFAELVSPHNDRPVADIGCGSGRVTGYVHRLGLPVFGIDLSPELLAVAREAQPDLRFDEGTMTALELEDGTLSGVLAWYSIIHVPDEELPEVFREFHRVLAPGGYLQLAFQIGHEPVHRTELGGHDVSLDFHRRHPDQIVELLRQTGLVERARLVRQPDHEGKYAEETSQGFVLARKPETVP